MKKMMPLRSGPSIQVQDATKSVLDRILTQDSPYKWRDIVWTANAIDSNHYTRTLFFNASWRPITRVLKTYSDGEPILEVGSGTGFLFEVLNKKAPELVTKLVQTERYLSVANENTKKNGNTVHVTGIQDLSTTLKQKFKTIVLLNVMDTIDPNTWGRRIQDLAKSLLPGGHIIFMSDQGVYSQIRDYLEAFVEKNEVALTLIETTKQNMTSGIQILDRERVKTFLNTGQDNSTKRDLRWCLADAMGFFHKHLLGERAQKLSALAKTLGPTLSLGFTQYVYDKLARTCVETGLKIIDSSFKSSSVFVQKSAKTNLVMDEFKDRNWLIYKNGLVRSAHSKKAQKEYLKLTSHIRVLVAKKSMSGKLGIKQKTKN